jgi:hypothetical protein
LTEKAFYDLGEHENPMPVETAMQSKKPEATVRAG